MLLLPVVAGLLYALGVRRRGSWPRGRSLAFFTGLALLAASALVDDSRSFPAHVGQHLLLGMAAPPLLALGAPVTLALQTASPGVRQRLRRALHHPIVAAVSHPVVAWVLFTGSLWALYFSPVLRWSVDHELVHVAVHLHFFAVGALFFWPIIALDPGPRRLSPPARLLLVALVVPVHAFLGLALLSRRVPLAGYPVTEVHAGAALLWIAGDLLAVGVLAVVVRDWIRSDDREAAREDRRADVLRDQQLFEERADGEQTYEAGHPRPD